MLQACRFLLVVICLSPLLAAESRAQDTGPLDVSGAWYDPSHDGEGWIVEVLPDGRAVVYWFTYPPAGADGEQSWVLGEGRFLEGVIKITDSIVTRGPTFGSGYDPQALVSESWGTWTMSFNDCATGSVNYSGPAGFGEGSFNIQRLSTIQGSGCLEAKAEADGTPGFSGSWFNLGTDGQGIILQVLPDGAALLYWFTYTPDGEQAWVLGVGTASGGRFEFPEMLMPVGTVFGEAFDPVAIELVPWGSLSLTLDTCGGGVMNFRSRLGGWGHGSLSLERLTSLDGHPCELPPPPAINKGRWLANVPMNPPLSEVAVTALDGVAYVAGGFNFGGVPTRSALGYSPGAGIRTLADLPAPRHHAMLAGHGDSLYLFGGFSTDVGARDTVWRYRPGGADRWTHFTTMPGGQGAAAAVSLGDHLYVITPIGIVWRLDPATREWRVLPGPGTGFRDHANAAAFRGEIWWLAGRRLGESLNTVEIFDPVTETWRAGPSLIYGHSGFAAAVIDGHIVIAGGEHPGSGTIASWTIEPHVEIYSPQAGRWLGGPPMPTPVHGVGAAAVDGRIYFLGGTTVPGATSGSAGIIQVFEPGE